VIHRRHAVKVEAEKTSPRRGYKRSLAAKTAFFGLAVPVKALCRFEVGKDESVFSRARNGLIKAALSRCRCSG
jgi:hypothetical protein